MITRLNFNLDGQWQFWIDPENAYTAATLPDDSARDITVPAPWQSQFPDLRLYSGTGWYRRTIAIPDEWLEQGLTFLKIGASDYRTEAWLNGKCVGSNDGGYLPFEFDLSQAALPGENELVIRVEDSPVLFPEVPHGKQGWYGPLSGIWQSVNLEHRASLFIRSIKVEPDVQDQLVRVWVDLSGPGNRPHRLKVRVHSPEGEIAAESNAPVPFRSASSEFSLPVGKPNLWCPEAPNLYTVVVELESEYGSSDCITKTFGFRTIESRNGRLYLNGEPIYMRGALDQDYYADTIYTTPSLEFLEDQIRKSKELGLNLLRIHIKVADPRYYEAADRMGMLIWTELPNWSVLTRQSGERGKQLMRSILERDGHHPSIIIWTIINEDWGTDLVHNPNHRAWLKDTFHWLKALDPTRLVVDNSPCEPNFHVESDIEDFHYYRAIPDHRKEWDRFVDRFASRADFTYTPHGDAVRTGQEPLIVSEFGNWGLPDANLLTDESGRDPWWFETGFEWSEGVVYPQGIRNRYKALGLDRVFGSWQDFVMMTQNQQFLAMKYQIEAMRRRPEICGYVITELTDVHWECNGLLDMRRNIKSYHYDLQNINADTVVIPLWDRVSYWSGETARVRLTVAHGAGADLLGSEVRWWLTGKPQGGCIDIPTISAGKSVGVGEIRFIAPDVNTPTVFRLALELRRPENELVNTNYLDVTVFPRPTASKGVTLYTSDPALAAGLQAMGYSLAERVEDAQAVVSSELTPDCLSYVEDGGRLLVLADRAAAPGMLMHQTKLEARGTGAWSGDWASSFSWLQHKRSFSNFPGGPLLDHSFDRVIPERVISGFRDWEFSSAVHAGILVGWVHKPAALIAERWYGAGKITFNTFNLSDENLSSDPTAVALMEGLVELSIN